jgi:hypothetical protein
LTTLAPFGSVDDGALTRALKSWILLRSNALACGFDRFPDRCVQCQAACHVIGISQALATRDVHRFLNVARYEPPALQADRLPDTDGVLSARGADLVHG